MFLPFIDIVNQSWSIKVGNFDQKNTEKYLNVKVKTEFYKVMSNKNM